MKVGNRRCQCSRCGKYFNSVSAFDKHWITRDGERTHLETAEMENIGMATNKAGYWITEPWCGLESPGKPPEPLA